jgi:hypothetical protein
MAEKEKILNANWPTIRDNLEKQLISKKSYTSALYDTQIWTNLVLDYAFRSKNLELLDQLAALYTEPFRHLTHLDTYWFYSGNRTKGYNGYIQLELPSTSPMWVKEVKMGQGNIMLETILHSSQFLYLVSHAVNCFVSLPERSLTVNMKQFVEKSTSTVLNHYQRWIFAGNGSTNLADSIGIFQTKAWGCDNGRYNHRQFIEKKMKREFGNAASPSYCNAIRDEDLWILCGAVELLAARKKKIDLFTMDGEQEKRYLDYFSIGSRLLEQRIEKTQLKDFNGRAVQGINVDPGAWNSHKDYRYAGFDGPDFPETDPARPNVPINSALYRLSDSLSWDISHARRFVQVFETLYRNRSVTRQPFPGKDVMEGLANQVAYGLFNGDFKKPLFKNFFDGSNGWYRVNYSNRKGFGYAPWDNSIEWLSSGMASWYLYQPDLDRVNKAVWTMIDSTNSTIKSFKSQHYEHAYYLDGQRKKRLCFKPGAYPYLVNFAVSSLMPPVAEKIPEISINRTRLNFATKKGDQRTFSQTVIVKNNGEGTLSWQAAGNAPWLSCTPRTELNTAEVTVTVNPGDLKAGVFRGKITFNAQEAISPSKTLDIALNIYRPRKKIKIIGSFDTPTDNQVVSGSVPVNGWALGETEIEKVTLYLEQKSNGSQELIPLGNAAFVEDARPDVATRYPDMPNSHRAGWGYMLLTNTLPNKGNGRFKLVVIARTTSGDQLKLGEKAIICNNANAKTPFGAIDTPVQGGVVSGIFRIIGWVLTPLPNVIPIDGSTIKVFVDSQFIGHARYNNPREDIRKLFPDCLNSNKSLAYFDLDTTKLKNGRHVLEWVVKDNAGNRAGIGSRYFHVRNG